MPASPRVPQVVPSKVLYAGAFRRLVPGSRADLPDRFALVSKYPCGLFCSLRAQKPYRSVVERHRDHLPGPCLFWMDPCRQRLADERGFGEGLPIVVRLPVDE